MKRRIVIYAMLDYNNKVYMAITWLQNMVDKRCIHIMYHRLLASAPLSQPRPGLDSLRDGSMGISEVRCAS